MEISQVIQYVERLGAAGAVLLLFMWWREAKRNETLQAQKDALLEQCLKALIGSKNAIREFGRLIGARDAGDDD